MSKPLEEPLKPEQAAAFLGMNISTLYKTIKRGEIEAFYIGDTKYGIRIDPEQIRKYKRKFSTSKFNPKHPKPLIEVFGENK